MIEPSAPSWAHRWYSVLAELRLARDAASLWRADAPRLLTDALRQELTGTYAAAPGRLALQFGPLWVDSEAELERLLAPGVLRSLDNTAGRNLAASFERALASIEPSEPECPATDDLVARLAVLRRGIWEGAEPPLLLWHCPALGSHARAITRRDGRRVVATDLNQPTALIQVFHEECHPRSDPTAVDRRLYRQRETRAGSPGFSVHAALERAAVALGERVLEQHMPELLRPYFDWKLRYGME